MRYFFLHPQTLKTCDIHNGRSRWEDHIDKADFIVVKELGPAMEYCEEATSPEITETLLEQIEEAIHARGYSGILADKVIAKLRK